LRKEKLKFCMSEKSPRSTLLAIALGLLTFIITPLVALLFALLISKTGQAFNPLVMIAKFFSLQGLGGFFIAEIMLISIIALLGNFIVAIISWSISRSKKLAAITFCSALVFQFVSAAVSIPISMRRSGEIARQGIETERSYQQFAKIGNVSYEVKEPGSDIEMGNSHPEYGPKYKKLEIIIPVSVVRAGTYLITAKYGYSSGELRRSTSSKEITQTFSAGDHTVKIEFLANQISGYGYWSPGVVGGKTKLQLYYLASKKELFEKIKANSLMDKQMLEQFIKDEGGEEELNNTELTVNKFVERKEVQF